MKIEAPGSRSSPLEMVKYFDNAYRVRKKNPETAVLAYALGTLFRIQRPTPELGRVAESCMSQVVLLEPGAAQKAFALWSYWALKGYAINRKLIIATIEAVIDQHQVTDFSNDVAWGLAFCLDYDLSLGKAASKTLSRCEDDCIALQALHMRRKGLLSARFNDVEIAKTLRNSDLDHEHWLLAYESARHGFLTASRSAVRANPLFADMLTRSVSFYKTMIDKTQLVLHFGSAPRSVASNWGRDRASTSESAPRRLRKVAHTAAPSADVDLGSVAIRPVAPRRKVKDLLDIVTGY